MSRGIRGVVVTTVCVTAAAMLANGAFFWTIPLVLGLIAEALAPRRRRWLIWVGAAFLTVIILPMEIRILPEFLTSRMDWMEAILLALWIASMCLIVWCDVVLFVDALKTRIHTVPQRRFRALGDSIVWISAVCFTVYSFWGILGSVRAYSQGLHRLDTLLTALTLALIALLFDTLLLTDAVMWFRARYRGAMGNAPSLS